MNLTNNIFLVSILILIIFGVSLGVGISFFSSKDSKNSDDSTLYQSEYLNTIEYTSSGNTNLNDEIKNVSDIQQTKKQHEPIKAVYLTGWSAGTKSKRQSVIDNLKNHGFNAVVIDIKDEAGQISYKSNVQTAIDISASKNMISNIANVLEEFHNADIYVIGRIVTFKDPIYAKKLPDNAYKKVDNSLWIDYNGNNWPNPYNAVTWEYPVALAKEAANLGFDEIQFDYIRFPSSEGKTKNISYGFDSEIKTKSEIINSFLKYAMESLKDYDVVISADVFGIITKKEGDFEHIGQDFTEIAKIVDVICPMIYPSHYGFGEYGIKYPDTEPYKIILYSLQDAHKQYDAISGDVKLAKIRPYLQDFTASWLKKGKYILYDESAVTKQLQACYDLKIYDFTLWDPNNKYAYEAINNIVVDNNFSDEVLVSGDTNFDNN